MRGRVPSGGCRFSSGKGCVRGDGEVDRLWTAHRSISISEIFWATALYSCRSSLYRSRICRPGGIRGISTQPNR